MQVIENRPKHNGVRDRRGTDILSQLPSGSGGGHRWQLVFPGRGEPLVPEARAALGLGRWPFAVVDTGRIWLSFCPVCWIGTIGLGLDRDDRAAPATLFCYRGLRCPFRRIEQAFAALRAGRPVEPTADDAGRLAPFLERTIPELWSGRRGRNPRSALWEARYTLEDTSLAPHLVRFALRALASRRGWPETLAMAIAPRPEGTA